MKRFLFFLMNLFFLLFFSSCKNEDNTVFYKNIYPLGRKKAQSDCEKYRITDGYLLKDTFSFCEVFNVLVCNGYIEKQPLSGYIKTKNKKYNLTSAFVKKEKDSYKSSYFSVYLFSDDKILHESFVVTVDDVLIDDEIFYTITYTMEESFTDSCVTEIYFQI